MAQYDIRVTEDHLAVRIALTVTHPDGTLEIESAGSTMEEALFELADEYSFRSQAGIEA